MNRFILPFVVGLTALPATAQNVTVFEVIGEGRGVIEYPSDLTPEAAATAIKRDRPTGATGIVMERGEPMKWTNLSADQVNENFGGEGTPEMRDLLGDPDQPDDPKVTEDEGQQTGNGDKITLAAGNWIGVVRSQTLDGCGGAIGQAVALQTKALNGKSIDGTIDAGFTPDKAAPSLDWVKTGANSWLADFAPGGGMRMQWLMKIKSPDLIENTQQIDALSCKAVTRVDYVRQ